MNSHICHWSPSFRVTIDWDKRELTDSQKERKKNTHPGKVRFWSDVPFKFGKSWSWYIKMEKAIVIWFLSLNFELDIIVDEWQFYTSIDPSAGKLDELLRELDQLPYAVILMTTLGERSLNTREESQAVEWDRDTYALQGSSRAFRSESEMESMRAVLLVFGASDELLSQSRPWNSQPPSAKISTFLMPFYSGKVNFYLMRTLEVATRRQDTAARQDELPIRSCRLLVKNTQVLGNIIALWNLWMKRFASSMSTSAYPMGIS